MSPERLQFLNKLKVRKYSPRTISNYGIRDGVKNYINTIPRMCMPRSPGQCYVIS